MNQELRLNGNVLRTIVIALHDRGEALKTTPGLTFSHGAEGTEVQNLAAEIDKMVAEIEGNTDLLLIREDKYTDELARGLDIEMKALAGILELKQQLADTQVRLDNAEKFRRDVKLRIPAMFCSDTEAIAEIDHLKSQNVSLRNMVEDMSTKQIAAKRRPKKAAKRR